MSPDHSVAIHPDLLHRLEELRQTLEENGVVQLRGDSDRRPSYRLRFRALDPDLGYRRHRSIILDDEDTANAVQALLADWRSQRTSEAQDVGPAPNPDVEKQRQWRRAVVQGGWRTRKRLAREFDEVASLGQMALYTYMATEAYLQPGPPPGRPRKARLSIVPAPAKPRGFTQRWIDQRAAVEEVLGRRNRTGARA